MDRIPTLSLTLVAIAGKMTVMSLRARLTVLAALALTALLTWQFAATYPVRDSAKQDAAITGTWLHSRDLVDGRSDVLTDFYNSKTFDPYVAIWADAATEADDYAQQCKTARSQVFVPPFRGMVDHACDDLLGYGEKDRLMAFFPVMTKFLRACRGGTSGPDGIVKHVVDPKPIPPYTASQWNALNDVVRRAVASDCDQRMPVWA